MHQRGGGDTAKGLVLSKDEVLRIVIAGMVVARSNPIGRNIRREPS